MLKEPKYELQVGFVAVAPDKKNIEQTKAIKESIKTGKGYQIQWQEPFWIKQSELAVDMNFVCNMQPGDISEPRKIAGGYQMYKLNNLKPERAVPLHKRYREIVARLQRPKFESMFTEYQQELLTG